MQMRAQAEEVLRRNDRGGYTVPSARLYPYQWNWDSGFVALGWLTFDEPRAWQARQLRAASLMAMRSASVGSGGERSALARAARCAASSA